MNVFSKYSLYHKDNNSYLDRNHKILENLSKNFIGAKKFGFSFLVRSKLNTSSVQKLDLVATYTNYNCKRTAEIIGVAATTFGITTGLLTGISGFRPGAVTGTVYGLGLGIYSHIFNQWGTTKPLRAIEENIKNSLNIELSQHGNYELQARTPWPGVDKNRLKIRFFCDEDLQLKTKIDQQFFKFTTQQTTAQEDGLSRVGNFVGDYFFAKRLDISITAPKSNSKGRKLFKFTVVIDAEKNTIPQAALRISKNSILSSKDISHIPQIDMDDMTACNYNDSLQRSFIEYEHALNASTNGSFLCTNEFSNLIRYGQNVHSIVDSQLTLFFPNSQLAFWYEQFLFDECADNGERAVFMRQPWVKRYEFQYCNETKSYHILLGYYLLDSTSQRLLQYKTATLVTFTADSLKGYRKWTFANGELHISPPDSNEFCLQTIYRRYFPTKNSYLIPSLDLMAMEEKRSPLSLFEIMQMHPDCHLLFDFREIEFTSEGGISGIVCTQAKPFAKGKDYHDVRTIMQQGKTLSSHEATSHIEIAIEDVADLQEDIAECKEQQKTLTAVLENLANERAALYEEMNAPFEGRSEEAIKQAKQAYDQLEQAIADNLALFNEYGQLILKLQNQLSMKQEHLNI